MRNSAVVLILLMILSLSACSLFEKKEPIDGDDFSEFMEDEDFIVEDVTNQFADGMGVSEVLVAVNDDFQIELYIVETEEQARRAYSENKEFFEDSFSGSGSSNSEINLGNHSKYTLTSSGHYCVVSRIDNTFIYANVDSDYKEDVQKLIKELGY